MRPSRPVVVVAPLVPFALLAAAFSCEPEVGTPCDPNPEQVAQAVVVEPGTNDLATDVRLDNCSQALCLSTDGSRPYCTIECITDLECPVDEGFRCAVAVDFGPLACRDFEDPAEEQPDLEGRSSRAACDSDVDCTSTGERCFTSGARAGTCGFVGRDCATGAPAPSTDAPSALRRTYCVGSPAVIEARDEAVGRAS